MPIARPHGSAFFPAPSLNDAPEHLQARRSQCGRIDEAGRDLTHAGFTTVKRYNAIAPSMGEAL
jgi:hypothetical protein